MIRPLKEIVSALLAATYFPVKDSFPRAPAKVDVPRLTFALPENDTASALAAQACTSLTTSLIAPGRPLRSAVPLRAKH